MVGQLVVNDVCTPHVLFLNFNKIIHSNEAHDNVFKCKVLKKSKQANDLHVHGKSGFLL